MVMDNLGNPVTNEQLLAPPLVPNVIDPNILNAINPGSALDSCALPAFDPPYLEPELLNTKGLMGDMFSPQALLGTPPVAQPLFFAGAGISGSLTPHSSSGLLSRELTNSNQVLTPTSNALLSPRPPAANSELTPEILSQLQEAAIERWASLGLSAAEVEKLRGTTLVVEDLLGNTLAETQGYQIIIDSDAAGQGWYVDLTPGDDSEFTQLMADYQLGATADSVAFGYVDLFSVLEHEYGHILA
jgi:hypothetical protein